MSDLSFHLAIHQAVQKDPRYSPHAYEFVRDALHTAVKHFRSGQEDQHVSGQEVLEGVRLHALSEYGPMAFTLLAQWGLHRGEDVGNVVYNLIDTGYFGRNEGDSLEDFSGGYLFEDAFAKPYEPRSSSSLQK
ncbi:MAG TPA: Minf_1886 family protein [Prosthecobacter sp.]|nr:Minf_1886 family protein [Prosthecobacter sp.]